MRERFDIFLSYAHVDAVAVARVVVALEQVAGLAVYRDGVPLRNVAPSDK
jgi:hypothetical protein